MDFFFRVGSVRRERIKTCAVTSRGEGLNSRTDRKRLRRWKTNVDGSQEAASSAAVLRDTATAVSSAAEVTCSNSPTNGRLHRLSVSRGRA